MKRLPAGSLWSYRRCNRLKPDTKNPHGRWLHIQCYRHDELGDKQMQRAAFSKSIDEPKLEHCRKHIVSHNVLDEFIGGGRLEWIWVGDDDVPFEKALTDPQALANVTDRMLMEGRFVFAYRGLKHPDRVRDSIEKYEIRRRLLGTIVYGYRASVSYPDVSDSRGYLVSKNLSDLNTKLFGFCVQQLDTEFLEERESVAVMASW